MRHPPIDRWGTSSEEREKEKEREERPTLCKNRKG
jgi:hypothetical protein